MTYNSFCIYLKQVSGLTRPMIMRMTDTAEGEHAGTNSTGIFTNMPIKAKGMSVAAQACPLSCFHFLPRYLQIKQLRNQGNPPWKMCKVCSDRAAVLFSLLLPYSPPSLSCFLNVQCSFSLPASYLCYLQAKLACSISS